MNLDTWITFSSLVLSLLGVTISLLVKVTKRIARIEYTLFPNGGSSLADKIGQTERKLDMLITRYETDREYRD
jgi:hypothetical protein